MAETTPFEAVTVSTGARAERRWRTFAQAYEYALAHREVWRIDLTLATGEKIELMRTPSPGAALGESWCLQQLRHLMQLPTENEP